MYDVRLWGHVGLERSRALHDVPVHFRHTRAHERARVKDALETDLLRDVKQQSQCDVKLSAGRDSLARKVHPRRPVREHVNGSAPVTVQSLGLRVRADQ